jgi:membrane peptidoglycan carboxypeptidase
LVKNTYLTSQRKLSRKVKEAVLADRLEKQYTKNQILDAYLNTIYLGSGAYGVQAASHVFFNEDLGQLTLPQAALLAGNIQSPSAYDPISDPTAARNRRAQVLARMVKVGSITQKQANAANVSPLPTQTTPLPQPAASANPYVQQVVNQLLGANSPLGSTKQQRYQALYEGGLKIYTNYDATTQAEAEGAIEGVLEPTNAAAQGIEEALVSINPSNGDVTAVYGGNSQFDIATQGTRQPGSGFKIFTLLAALEQGYSINSLVNATAPCAIAFPPSATGTSEGNYALLASPAENDEGPGSGGVTTIANSTAQSYNCAFIRLAYEIKLTSVISMARQLGVTAPLNAYPSMVLGADDVEPLQMAAAYATVADGGVYHAPAFINHVVDRTGATIYNGESPGKQVISTAIADQATTAFRDVVLEGTGASAAVPGHEIAGKTGTTSGPTNAWFNGFTPQVETTVWMGNPTEEKYPMIVDGAEVYGTDEPAETFKDFMASALQHLPDVPLPVLTGSEIPAGKPVNSAALDEDDHSVHGDELYVPPPVTAPPATTPTTAPATTAPSDTTPDTTPAVTTPDTTPVTAPADTTPVTAPADTTPVTAPAVTSPPAS